jgi:spore coat protein CotH
MKGNTSRIDFYNQSEGIYNLIHFKIDFQETFDDEEYYGSDAIDWTGKDEEREARKDRTFATMEKLEMKWNRNYDNTYIREYYSYEMFRANGVLAPHTNLASTDLSSVHLGVYMIYEPVDDIFIEKNLPEKEWGGDLYKCGWTMSPANFTSRVSIGVEDEDKGLFYNYDLKTNKKKSTHAELKNLLTVLNRGTVTKEQYESVVDVDNFVKFAACSYFTGNPDDMRNNYNNYYVYFLKSSGKAIMIPYDLDRCMGVTTGYNPTGNGNTKVSPFSEWAQGKGERQANPVYKYSVIRNAYYVDEYSSALIEVGTSEWMTTEHFNKYYNIAKKHYAMM